MPLKFREATNNDPHCSRAVQRNAGRPSPPGVNSLQQRQIGVTIGRQPIALLICADRRAERLPDFPVDLTDIITQFPESGLQSSDLNLAQGTISDRPVRGESSAALRRISA